MSICQSLFNFEWKLKELLTWLLFWTEVRYGNFMKHAEAFVGVVVFMIVVFSRVLIVCAAAKRDWRKRSPLAIAVLFLPPHHAAVGGVRRWPCDPSLWIVPPRIARNGNKIFTQCVNVGARGMWWSADDSTASPHSNCSPVLTGNRSQLGRPDYFECARCFLWM